MTVRRAATIVLLAASVLLASGCGIEQESTASRTDPDAVPFGLLEEPEAAPAAPADDAEDDVEVVPSAQLVEALDVARGSLEPEPPVSDRREARGVIQVLRLPHPTGEDQADP